MNERVRTTKGVAIRKKKLTLLVKIGKWKLGVYKCKFGVQSKNENRKTVAVWFSGFSWNNEYAHPYEWVISPKENKQIWPKAFLVDSTMSRNSLPKA